MQGTILVIDGVSTNRILLKVQLADAYFDVVQAGCIKTLRQTLIKCRPDLVITALTLSDGTASDVKQILSGDDALRNVPVVAIDTQNTSKARLEALELGVDDVLTSPVDQLVLQARIRSLLRTRSDKEELRMQRDAAGAFEFPITDASHMGQVNEATVAVITESPHIGRVWCNGLAEHSPFQLRRHRMADIRGIMSEPVPDAIVIELNQETAGLGMRLIADLRARGATRQSILVAIPDRNHSEIAAEALDRGAHDVLQNGFDAQELALRLTAQLTQKMQDDRLRDSIRSELKAAVLDPMTGLHNRRYAKPFLDRVIHHARETGESFALMVADLDHFKRINDAFGHPTGDAVLVETAARLKALMRPSDLLARIGGEEFLLVLPGMSASEGAAAAAAFCAAVNEHAFKVYTVDQPIRMTISVGAVIGGRPRTQDMDAAALIAEADRALYAAKNSGRNRAALSPQSPVAA